MTDENHDFVGVHGDAKIVYVLVADRLKFDQIPLPCVEHDNRVAKRGHLLSKTLDADQLMVVFQHWLENIEVTKTGR
jgi:hypothetical protein